MKKLLLLIVFAVAVTSVLATSYTWNGGSSTWNTPGNWTPNGTPGTGDDVTISSATPITITLGNATLVNTLSVSGGSTISFAGAFTFQTKAGLTFSGGTKISLTSTSAFTLGDGTTTFSLTGNDANNYFTGTSGNGYLSVYTPAAYTTNLYVDPAFTWYNFTVQKGTTLLKSNCNTTRLGLSSANSEKLQLDNGVTFTINATGSSSLGVNGATNIGYIDASATGSKVVITGNNNGVATVFSGNFKLFNSGSLVNSLEFNASGYCYYPNAPITVNTLTLTAGTINTSNNSITIADGGSITRSASAAMLQTPLIFGGTTNVTIGATTATAGNELLKATSAGKVGTLNVKDGVTYTLNSSGVTGISLTNIGYGYTSAPIVTFTAPTNGTAATAIATVLSGVVTGVFLTSPGVGYTTTPTFTIAAPGTINNWTASATYTANTVVKNGNNYYICTTAGQAASSGGPTGYGTGIVDNVARWSFFTGPWVTSATYTANSTVTNGGNVYLCVTSGAGATSGSGPSGTGVNIADGTNAKWNYIGAANPIGTQATGTATYNSNNSLAVDNLTIGTGTSGIVNYPNNPNALTLNLNNNLTVNAGGTLAPVAQTNNVTHLLNVGGNIINSGTFTTSVTNGKLDVTMNGSSAQAINSAITFNGLTIANTTSPVSAGAALNTTNLTINANATLNMQSNALNTVTTTSGTGKLQTQATASAIPSGKTWSFNVEYNNATGGQTVIGGTYTGGLTMSNNTGVNTVGSVTIGNVLTLNAGSNLQLTNGNTITAGLGFTGSTGSGTLQINDNNSTAYRIPRDLTWGGTVQFNFAGNSRIVPGIYNNLQIDDGSARTVNWGLAGETGTYKIGGTLTTSSTSYALNQTTIEFNGTDQSIPRINTYNLKLSGSGTTFPATYLYIANNFDPGSIASANQGTIVFNGTASQTIPAFGYYSLNVSNTAGAILNSNLSVPTLTINASGIMDIAAGKQLTVSTSMTNNGTINLRSTSTDGTATILTPATIGGTNAANVEQYLASSRNWYMSSPVTGATASAGPTYYKYVEALNNGSTWTAVNSGDGFDVMTGYIVKPTAEATYNFNGTLNTGNKTISGLTSTATAKTGFNLVGNPYPSYVKWSEVVKTNVGETMWYRTHDGSSYKFYTYHPVDGAGGIGVPATVTNYIPPMQAFWVKVTAAQTGSLQFLNSSRDHKDGAGSVFRAPKATDSAMKLLRLQVSNTTENDETVLYFNANASDNLDSYDSQKMFNNNAAIPEIYTIAGAEKLVINGMSDVKYDTEIPLGFVSGQANTFSIKATELKNFEAGTRIILRDKVDVVDYELNGDNAYTFTSDAVNSTSRFSVLFKSPSVTTDIADAKNSNLNAYVNANNNIVISASEKATYSIYNAMGQLIKNGKLNAKRETLNAKLAAGVYMVNVNNQTTKVIIK